MKFTILPEHGVKQLTHMVWDAAADKPLCTFTDGEFETEDTEVIEKLKALGYDPEDAPVVMLDKDDDAELKGLRAKAKELGVTSAHLMGIERLKEEIAKKEGV